MQGQTDVRTLGLDALAAGCERESRRTGDNEAASPGCCHELFRRAIYDRDQVAWALLLDQYRRIVLSWISRNPLFYSSGEEAEFFAQEAFARMWKYITPEKFERLPSIGALLAYLKMCANSTLVDYVRRRDQPEDELSETLPQPQDTSMERADVEQLWRVVDAQLHDGKEWLVVRGLFVWGFKPHELLQRYPRVFRDVREIYNIRENVVNRLRRDAALTQFLPQTE